MSTIVRVTTDDAELVRDALNHDQGAWNQLVAKYTRLVWHVIHGFSQLDAERKADVHQTAWLRLAEQLHRINDPAKVGGWLASTARHECIRQVRLAAREIPEAEFADHATFDDPAHDLLSDERDQEVKQAFRELRPECQQLLRLLIADPPFTYDEICEILEMRRGSVGPTRSRCLAQLRTTLESSARKEF